MGKHGWGYYAARRYFVHTMMRSGRQKKQAQERVREQDRRQYGKRWSNMRTSEQIAFLIVFWFIALTDRDTFRKIHPHDKIGAVMFTVIPILIFIGFVALMVHASYAAANQPVSMAPIKCRTLI